MGVLAIWRYPVKAMLGELLRERLEVRPGHLKPRAVIDNVVTRLRGRA